jgi:hypothetical protein
MQLIDTYRIFHLAAAQYTFFSAAHGTFSKIDTKQVSTNIRKLKLLCAYSLVTIP